MRMEASAQVEVPVTPDVAFEIFTTEIDLWWVRGPINHYDSSRLVELRMEPGVGGRVLEVYDETSGDVSARERVTVWEPGRRLALEGDVTGVEIDFAGVEGGTRVSVRQFLLPTADPEQAGFGWANMLRTYDAWTRRRDTAPRTPREIDRLGIALHYKDPAGMARWLRRVFQLGDWDVDRAPEPGEHPSWIEFHVGNGLVLLFGQDDLDLSAAPGSEVWVHVDDLDQHFRHARHGGAKIISEIRTHGSTQYRAEDPEGQRWTFVQARPTMRIGPGPIDGLAAAAAVGTSDVAQSLLQKVDTHQAGLLLHRFAREGDHDAVGILLAAGVDVDTLDDTGATALHHAAGGGHLACIETLIDGHADLDRRDHVHGSSPVLWAHELGRLDAVRLLLARGARINAPDAAKLGLSAMVGGFLDEVPETVDRAVGWPTPLSAAIANGHVETARLLLERGADPNARTGSGDLPLDCLRWLGDDSVRDEIAALLVAHGARSATSS
ncbi:ankyrin repeat domain-containing protein [Microlunatus soli]|uniref:Ankyrin repeat-containing protein n=1 Tax=Microlunatus soli TaxID=630515 RepID=A0A1H1RYK5_9ACTN|nr:ankyrin repeat domain-containing protein [Microlunatus soli]SDS40821.1 Ankyrin repeat-containing protein [Microlunatus soli]